MYTKKFTRGCSPGTRECHCRAACKVNTVSGQPNLTFMITAVERQGQEFQPLFRVEIDCRLMKGLLLSVHWVMSTVELQW